MKHRACGCTVIFRASRTVNGGVEYARDHGLRGFPIWIRCAEHKRGISPI